MIKKLKESYPSYPPIIPAFKRSALHINNVPMYCLQCENFPAQKIRSKLVRLNTGVNHKEKIYQVTGI